MSKLFKPSSSLLALAAATFMTLQAAPAAAVQRGGVAAAAAVSDQLIVKYRSAAAADLPAAATLQRANAAAQPHGVKLGHLRRLADGAHVLKLDKALSVAELRQLAQTLGNGDADVEYAEPDLILRPQLTPDDASYPQQWDLFEATAGLNLPTAWDKSTGAGVVVAVVDTGVRPHADLAANLLPGYDFISTAAVSNDGGGRDGDASDAGDWTVAGQCASGSPAANSSWHGTHVSGTIAAVTNNAGGVAGVAFGAKVLPVRALGSCGGYTSDIADGITWAVGGSVTNVPANPNPAQVVNMSLGGTGACPTTYQNAINAARARGAVVVVAAGNSNADAANFTPANCAGVVTVAAVNRAGARASYSNYGAPVDLAAPGGDIGAGILSTLNSGTTTPGADSYAWYMGTSMATPHVAGTAALMLARNPYLSPDEVEARLKGAVRPFAGACDGCGTGMLDANAAVDAAGTPPAVTGVTELESNNSLGTAQPLPVLPALVQGTIAANSGKNADLDYYSVTVPAGATLRARLTPNASSNYDLYAYNGAGTLLASGTGAVNGAIDAVSWTNATGAAATLLLRVSRVTGLTGATGTYSLAVQAN